MIRGAIFDMDGTLLDSMHIWDTLGVDYLAARGIQPPPGLREDLKPLNMLETVEYLRTRFGIPGSDREIIAGINGMVAGFYRDTLPLKPGVDGFLRRLAAAGVRLCVATATDRPLTEAALRRCGVLDLFEFVLTCSEVGVGKRRPDIFERALARLGTEKAETPVFEDSPHAILTAADAGFRVVAVRDPSAAQEPELEAAYAAAERLITTFDECEVDSL